VHEHAHDEPQRLAECRDEEQEEHRDRCAVLGARPTEDGHDARHERHADHEPERDTRPRERTRREAEAPTADAGPDGEHEHDEIERVQRGLGMLRCPRRAVARG
jgi:hypothetical protein